MNMTQDSQIIKESYCSITSDVFKFLPKKDLPFSLHRMNSSSGKFSPITVPGKVIVSALKQTIINDCDRGLIFIKCSDITECKSFLAANLKIVIRDIADSIPEHDLASIIIEGLKLSAATIYVDSVKINFKEFHETLCAVGELLHDNPELIWLMMPLLATNHSLVNKSVSSGIIGSAVILLGRDSRPDINVFLDAFCALVLCDIGLCNLPEFVLGKEFCLTLDEQKRIRQHPITSVELLSITESLSKTTLRAILEHHERMDGSGYPRGVSNEHLSWLGKLCGAVDSFVAMTMERPGKKRIPTVAALKILYRESTQYDPNIIYALEKVTYKE
ncbi:HD-GYP domain-containing protein [Maridesulfovibrio hydrothermalis]|uniref:Putative metal dependent phosphohydrolase n=1 Tax=Maridesulfovibrio hydrothermalis AM13 = DSM 14728 TaxID=1121451 RepID=L0R9Z1_9BACT|nr:HD domain-containing phosphohydrolase [Maridesulfovibrio hydrothermalis]CCO23569.1 putative metal dependent phosphohydrolase [Maridesulfovibrio hydrothermalis AM13 = DSM 14728]